MSTSLPSVRIVGCLPLTGLLFLVGCGVNAGSAPSAQDIMAAQANAIEALKAKGTVEEKQYPPGKAYAVDLSGAEITEEDLEHLKAIATVAELNLSGSTISDEQFTKLASAEYKMNVLFRLDISDTEITDAGFQEAADLNLLSEINTKGSQVSDAGIQAFKAARGGKKLPFGMQLKIQK